ncbi:hypothetical protein O9Z70_02740 [Devosia sp. YIM 151766]|uniref:hypothetical protein n=1 Tax=Devosia sp. YIM 151766 TaxID=3017325 RepID=UPI00255C50BE|nr:hypothetical protein [Devosia sp. YIM 151766]WIY53474.1 hypothetical protein O9Z70_02740 [Devosia sp. YIM 151766]
MSEAATHQRFLIISNGHGEDWIAAALATRLTPLYSVDAYPVVGSGNAYGGICPVVGPRASLDSGGARTAKGSLRRDLAKGGLAMVPPALKFMRSVRDRYDRIVVVGDVMVPLLAWLTGHKGLFYIDCYKTGAGRLYSAAERFVLGKTCAKVFCRADNLAEMLRQSGIDASAPGNLMMDTIPHGDYDAASRRTERQAITLLPGSRGETVGNFARQIAALRQLPVETRPDIFLAVAGDVRTEDLAEAAGLKRGNILSTEGDDLGSLGDGTLVVHLLRGRAMGNALDVSDIVLSQAGTASVQALGLGKPVIHMTSPKDRQSRFLDEQKLFGEARIAVPGQPEALAKILSRLLASPEERERLGAIGRQRIGGAGALDQVLAALTA